MMCARSRCEKPLLPLDSEDLCVPPARGPHGERFPLLLPQPTGGSGGLLFHPPKEKENPPLLQVSQNPFIIEPFSSANAFTLRSLPSTQRDRGAGKERGGFRLELFFILFPLLLPGVTELDPRGPPQDSPFPHSFCFSSFLNHLGNII